MRRSARGDQTAFSLFPFLAVLLCTMGSLVVLLVAISQLSREKAEAEAEAARIAAANASVEADSPQRRDLDAKIVEAVAALSRLRLVKSEGETRLQQEQKRLSDIEDHLRRLSDEAESLVAETKELFAVEQQHYDDAKIAAEELERLNRLAGEIEDEIEKLKHAAVGRERKFAVVSLREGQSGTLRPPVYFECVEAGVILQPEGIVLGWEDLVAPEFSSPLAAAARTVERYYEEHPEARAANENGNPYPLMIVRPDGVRSHRYAQAAFNKAGLDFGFQPVAADWSMEYGASNPVLGQAVEDALRATRFERQGLARITPQLAEAMEEAQRSEISAELTSGTDVDGGAQAPSGPGVRALGSLRIYPANPNSNNPFEGLRIEGSLPGETGSVGVLSGNGGGGPGRSMRTEANMPLLDQPKQGEAAGEASSGPAGIAASQADTEGLPDAPEAGTQGSRTGAATATPTSSAQSSSPVASAPTAAVTGDSADNQMAGQASISVAPNNGDKTHTGGPNTQPSSGREGVPMIRPIRLYVSNDRVAILPDGAQTPADMVRASQSQAVRFEGPTTGQINDVIGMLKKYAESWGIAGDGMYWDPRLVLNIDADGAQRADDVRRLLEAAGIKVQAYPVTTAANPEGGSDASRR